MDSQEEDQGDGEHPVEDQNHWNLIEYHPEQAGEKAHENQCQQRKALRAQLVPVGDGMDDGQQEEEDRRQLVDMDARQGDQDSQEEADGQGVIQNFFHALTGSFAVAGMVLMPKTK